MAKRYGTYREHVRLLWIWATQGMWAWLVTNGVSKDLAKPISLSSRIRLWWAYRP